MIEPWTPPPKESAGQHQLVFTPPGKQLATSEDAILEEDSVLTKKQYHWRCCQRASSCMGCTLRIGIWFQVVIKILFLIGVIIAAQLPKQTLHSAGLWLGLVDDVLLAGDAGIQAPNGANTGTEQCQDALRKYRNGAVP